MSPIDTVKGLAGAQMDQFRKAGKAFQEGRYVEGIGQGAAGMLPVLGPAAASIGEQMGSGDIAGGLGAALPSLVPAGALGAAFEGPRSRLA